MTTPGIPVPEESSARLVVLTGRRWTIEDVANLPEDFQRVTVDEPWEVTLDPPAWTGTRDRIREVARPDK
jgi:hypothetical protein